MAATLAARRWMMPVIWGLLIAAAVVGAASTFVLTSARCLATSAFSPDGACGASGFERALLAVSAVGVVAGSAGLVCSVRRSRAQPARSR